MSQSNRRILFLVLCAVALLDTGAHITQSFVNYPTWHLIDAGSFPAYHRAITTRAVVFLLVPQVVEMLAGSGVKSQSNIGFPEGLAGSTQFTISLPVSRMRLLGVRAAFGMLETAGAAVAIYCLTWGLFPVIRSNVSLADFARLLVANILCLTVPYFAAVFFGTFVDEPLNMNFAGWAIVLLLWLAHHVAPSVDIILVYGAASPVLTHRLPWSQIAASAGIAAALFFAAVRVVQTREY
jgi:hypothetical protein